MAEPEQPEVVKPADPSPDLSPFQATQPLHLPKLRYVPTKNYGSRKGTAVRLVVLHDCEGSYAGSIEWFRNPKSAVSAHYVLRDNGQEATQMVDLSNSAWHVRQFNSCSIGIEMAGFASKGFNAVEWDAAAAMVAYLLHRYHLPAEWSRDGSGSGFCRHYDLGEAGGGHSDPTTDNVVWGGFIQRVQAAYAQQAPADWTVTSDATAPAGAKPSTHADLHDLDDGSIEWVQQALNAAGARPLLTVDGDEGPRTETAVAAYQQAHGLAVTSRIDAALISQLKGGTTNG